MLNQVNQYSKIKEKSVCKVTKKIILLCQFNTSCEECIAEVRCEKISIDCDNAAPQRSLNKPVLSPTEAGSDSWGATFSIEVRK